MLTKKAITAVIGISLILIVTVVAFISFQGWFQTFSSKVSIDSTQQISSQGIEFQEIDDRFLYLRSPRNNLSFSALKINDDECELQSPQLSKGLNRVDISPCLENLQSGDIADVVISTPTQVISKQFVSTFTPLPDGFITVWDTRIVDGNTSASNQISLPLVEGGTYNFNVTWGDGTSDIITSWNQAEKNHTYAEEGIYEVIMNGTIVGFDFVTNISESSLGFNTHDAKKLLEVKKWGPLNLINSEGFYFSGTNNLEISAWDPLNLTGVTNLTGMFANYDLELFFTENKSLIDGIEVTGTINNWDVSNIRFMDGLFLGNTFNQPLDNWDVANVVSMQSMFTFSNFNQDISSWDVSNVIAAGQMFSFSNFNQPLNNWDTSNLISMEGMFVNSQFNQDISSWDVSNVQLMPGVFSNSLFNQDISTWNTSNVLIMDAMFENAINFNQNLSSWDTANVTDMDRMFFNAINFNQNLSSWDVSSVSTCSNFNGSTPSWTLPKPNFTLCSPGGAPEPVMG